MVPLSASPDFCPSAALSSFPTGFCNTQCAPRVFCCAGEFVLWITSEEGWSLCLRPNGMFFWLFLLYTQTLQPEFISHRHQSAKELGRLCSFREESTGPPAEHESQPDGERVRRRGLASGKENWKSRQEQSSKTAAKEKGNDQFSTRTEERA